MMMLKLGHATYNINIVAAKAYGIAVDPSINRQLKPGIVGWVTSMKATDAIYPSMIPKAVHICG